MTHPPPGAAKIEGLGEREVRREGSTVVPLSIADLFKPRLTVSRIVLRSLELMGFGDAERRCRGLV